MQGGLGLLSKFLNGQYTVHVDHVVEVTRDAFELLFHVRAHGGSDFNMMTG
jgi:hypothetical protein